MRKLASAAAVALGLTAVFPGAGHAVAAASSCHPRTVSVASLPASAVLRTMAANLSRACGFTISGALLMPGFADDSLELTAPGAYDARGSAHLRYVDQGIFIDVYRVGATEYLRVNGLSADAVPLWHEFGVTSAALIKAAGSANWVRLTTTERKVFDKALDGAGHINSPAALGASLATGFGRPWHLHGLTSYRGVRCVELTQSWTLFGQPGSTALFVAVATGLPIAVVYPGDGAAKATFGNWGHVAMIAAPPAARVVWLT